MAYKVDLDGTRGDQFLRAIALQHLTTPPTPLTVQEATAIRNAYPLIQMQVRASATEPTVLIELSSQEDELSIEVSYPLPNGTLGPALVISASAEKCQEVFSGKYDVQFSGSGVGPHTWIEGNFKLKQDVTREAD